MMMMSMKENGDGDKDDNGDGGDYCGGGDGGDDDGENNKSDVKSQNLTSFSVLGSCQLHDLGKVELE